MVKTKVDKSVMFISRDTKEIYFYKEEGNGCCDTMKMLIKEDKIRLSKKDWDSDVFYIHYPEELERKHDIGCHFCGTKYQPVTWDIKVQTDEPKRTGKEKE